MATVSILLALCEGAALLQPQLDSIAAQDHADWRLIVGDDGSRDGGAAIVDAFAARHAPGQVRRVAGPGRGAAANFLALLHQGGDGDFAAFCDQDDVWLPHKLGRAVAALAGAGSGPAVYAGRRLICDATLDNRRLSPGLARPPGFRNALVENILPGNTLVLNPAAVALLRAASPPGGQVVMHDWWVYLVVTGAGGRVVWDDTPGVLYRQHGHNLVGANDGATAIVRRARGVAGGRFRGWTDRNLAALDAAAPLLTAENRQVVQDFAAARRGPAWARLAAIRRLRLYRQRPVAQAALWLAALAGRV